MATVALLVGVAGLAARAQSRTASSTVTLQISLASHSSLKVSSSVLRFDVDAAGVAPASLEFSAGARTRSGGDVLLSVESIGPVDGPAGVSRGDLEVLYRQEGADATAGGTLSQQGPTIVARWIGSGLRQGRIIFSLRGATRPGSYSVPVRVALSMP